MAVFVVVFVAVFVVVFVVVFVAVAVFVAGSGRHSLGRHSHCLPPQLRSHLCHL